MLRNTGVPEGLKVATRPLSVPVYRNSGRRTPEIFMPGIPVLRKSGIQNGPASGYYPGAPEQSVPGADPDGHNTGISGIPNSTRTRMARPDDPRVRSGEIRSALDQGEALLAKPGRRTVRMRGSCTIAAPFGRTLLRCSGTLSTSESTHTTLRPPEHRNPGALASRLPSMGTPDLRDTAATHIRAASEERNRLPRTTGIPEYSEALSPQSSPPHTDARGRVLRSTGPPEDPSVFIRDSAGEDW